MRLLIHDLSSREFLPFAARIGGQTTVIADIEKIRPCIGCFGCWVKTPCTCLLKDAYRNMGPLIANCGELIIISRCVYGGFSPFVKNTLDRSIAYIHPYLVIRAGEVHHKPRYSHQITLKAGFYGEAISDAERQTAQRLVAANGLNFNVKDHSVRFTGQAHELMEEYVCGSW